MPTPFAVILLLFFFFYPRTIFFEHFRRAPQPIAYSDRFFFLLRKRFLRARLACALLALRSDASLDRLFPSFATWIRTDKIADAHQQHRQRPRVSFLVTLRVSRGPDGAHRARPPVPAVHSPRAGFFVLADWRPVNIWNAPSASRVSNITLSSGRFSLVFGSLFVVLTRKRCHVLIVRFPLAHDAPFGWVLSDHDRIRSQPLSRRPRLGHLDARHTVTAAEYRHRRFGKP